MKTEDTEALGRPSKIKARYSRPTCKNCSYLCAPLQQYGTQYCNTETGTHYIQRFPVDLQKDFEP